MARKRSPVHPGEVLLEEFLKPMSISQYKLAKDISVPPRRINEIVLGKRAVTADTALRLSRYLGTSEGFWLNLQARFDLEVQKDRLGIRLETEVHVLQRSTAVSRSVRGLPAQSGKPERHPTKAIRSGFIRKAK